jgi:hypothetical protein
MLEIKNNICSMLEIKNNICSMLEINKANDGN